jgi:beta-galactosidase
MRKYALFNDNWSFVKENKESTVTLPHTWNAIDGQDGGNDYYRGVCSYRKCFEMPEISDREELWIEFRGAAMIAGVYLNGKEIGTHEGGYSTFRFNLTPALAKQNELEIKVDNSANRRVYPQKADFTFYGGLYRDVYLITVPKEHFSLGYYGSSGLKITPRLYDTYADVDIECFFENTADNASVEIKIESIGELLTHVSGNKAHAVIRIDNVRLWDGLDDPFLYQLTACLTDSGDFVQASFGCRSFEFDPQKGFFLNGRSYPLCGAARHQDWAGVGSAITKKMQDTDMTLMIEMGANTIRLAHYQHDQYFYDLCDKAGMVVWTEIPYITEHMPEGRENTISQMKELVLQNYNHPSVVCWALSNEITAVSGVTDDLQENHHILNDLCHSLDKTRPTCMANVFMLEDSSSIVTLPDIRSYNLYYGWYVGELSDNDRWFDNFHEKYPEVVIGLSEYGADANPQYQSSNPEKGDYTESYQAVFHEHMLKMWCDRPYIWGMHVWNMFDFGADGREEGGKPGQNQKGLVTFDRKTKKDAFYIYKAYLSKEAFVHICSRRFVDRVGDSTEIKVYSNQSEVSLFVDGKLLAEQKGQYVFTFDVPISAKHKVEAVSGDFKDSIEIRKAPAPNPNYTAPGRDVTNWFEKDMPVEREGYFSIKNTMGELNNNPEVRKILQPLMSKAAEAYGDVAKNIQIPESMRKMMDATTLETTLKQMGSIISPGIISDLNSKLNQIKIS